MRRENETDGYYTRSEVANSDETFHHYGDSRINTQYSNECSTVSSVTQPSTGTYSWGHSPHSAGTEAKTVVHVNDGGFSNSYHPSWQGHHPHHHSSYNTYGYYEHRDDGQVYGPGYYSRSYDADAGHHHGPPAPSGHHHDEQNVHGSPFPSSSYDVPWYEYHGAPEAMTTQRIDHHANNDPDQANAYNAPMRHFHPIPDEVAESRNDEPGSPFLQPTPYVGDYNERDILCGRGALMIWHPGNQYFRRLVQTHRQRYFFSRRQEKKNIASQIINEVKNRGGRFLRRSQATDGLNEINVWVEIEEERAYQKTCQALREGAPEIRRQYRSKPSRRAAATAERVQAEQDTTEQEDDAASK